MTLPVLLEGVFSLLLPAVCCACGSSETDKEYRLLCSACETCVPFSKPPWCSVCGQTLFGLGAGIDRCRECRSQRYFFDQALSACSYEGVAKQLVVSLKYKKRLSIAPFLGEMLCRMVCQRLGADPADMVVPVPLHPVRFRERSFNQAELLARIVSMKIGRPLRNDLLARPRATRSQAELDKKQRYLNVRDAFEPAKDSWIPGARVLLVDDVFTTGATANACAKRLKEAGAEKVIVVTIAHG